MNFIETERENYYDLEYMCSRNPKKHIVHLVQKASKYLKIPVFYKKPMRCRRKT